MPHFDPFAADSFHTLTPTILRAILASELPGLDGNPSDSSLESLLGDPGESVGMNLNRHQEALVTSGLWLLAGDLDQSHRISQDIPTADGSFWHGIMHRREGDFGNAKYWFRKVGAHPVLADLVKFGDGDYVDPFQFVDHCSRAIKSGGEDYQQCVRLQWIEWQALMVHCLDL